MEAWKHNGNRRTVLNAVSAANGILKRKNVAVKPPSDGETTCATYGRSPSEKSVVHLKGSSNAQDRLWTALTASFARSTYC